LAAFAEIYEDSVEGFLHVGYEKQDQEWEEVVNDQRD
jgi:hypothetical protein